MLKCVVIHSEVDYERKSGRPSGPRVKELGCGDDWKKTCKRFCNLRERPYRIEAEENHKTLEILGNG